MNKTYTSDVVRLTIIALQRAIALDIPEYRRAFQPTGLSLFLFKKTQCPALTSMNRRLASMAFMKEAAEYRVMARRIWEMREQRLSDMMALAHEDARTTKEEEDEIHRLWCKVVDMAYPVGCDEMDAEHYEPGYC